MNFDSTRLNANRLPPLSVCAKLITIMEPKLIQTVRGVGYMLEVPDGQ
jgi:two-component system copper resistance phosphate regulon response regulator CusR